jgi:hypothetical protein
MIRKDDFGNFAEAVLKSAKLNTASAASRSVCSRAKPTAHTGFGISKDIILYFLGFIIAVVVLFVQLCENDIGKK